MTVRPPSPVPRNPFSPPAVSDRPSLGSEIEFRRLNLTNRLHIGLQVLVALFFVALLTLCFVLYEMSLAATVGATLVGVLVAATYLVGQSRRWARVGDAGLSLGGQFVPWSDVFFLGPLPTRGERFLTIGWHEGREMKLLAVPVGRFTTAEIARLGELIRPEVTEAELHFLRSFHGDRAEVADGSGQRRQF